MVECLGSGRTSLSSHCPPRVLHIESSSGLPTSGLHMTGTSLSLTRTHRSRMTFQQRSWDFWRQGIVGKKKNSMMDHLLLHQEATLSITCKSTIPFTNASPHLPVLVPCCRVDNHVGAKYIVSLHRFSSFFFLSSSSTTPPGRHLIIQCHTALTVSPEYHLSSLFLLKTTNTDQPSAQLHVDQV